MIPLVSASVADLTPSQWALVAADLMISLGFVVIAFRLTPLLPVRRRTMVAAFGLFAFSAMNLFDEAMHTLGSLHHDWDDLSSQWHMLVIHVPQAVPQAVFLWLFIFGFLSDLRLLRERAHGGREPSGTE